LAKFSLKHDCVIHDTVSNQWSNVILLFKYSLKFLYKALTSEFVSFRDCDGVFARFVLLFFDVKNGHVAELSAEGFVEVAKV